MRKPTNLRKYIPKEQREWEDAIYKFVEFVVIFFAGCLVTIFLWGVLG